MKWFKRFQMSETTFNQINSLPEEMQLKFYKALCNYGLNSIEPDFSGTDNAIWIPMKDLIDNSRRRSEINSDNGKKGGAPVGNNNRKQATLSEINRNQPNIASVMREAEMHGYYIDAETAQDFLACELEPAWFGTPHSFIEFVAGKIDEKYSDKLTGERKALFISAVKSLNGAWDDFRNEYPDWLSKKQRAYHVANVKKARDNRPEICKCGGKLVGSGDGVMYCLECRCNTVFDEKNLKWIYQGNGGSDDTETA